MDDILAGITFWYWWVFAVLMVILETLAPGVIFLWLAISATALGFTLLVVTDLAWQYQFLLFAGLSIVSVAGGRLWVKRHPTESEHPTLNRRGEQYVGRRFTLSEPIVDGIGKITVDDTTWQISGDDMPAGVHVTVTGIDGSIFRIEKTDTTSK